MRIRFIHGFWGTCLAVALGAILMSAGVATSALAAHQYTGAEFF
jgi:hypothetical protein